MPCSANANRRGAGVGIGEGKDDYLVPDLALHRQGYAPQWHPTAALVVEIVSPGDKTWEKLGFYAAHHVDELLIVDPAKQKVDWLTMSLRGAAASREVTNIRSWCTTCYNANVRSERSITCLKALPKPAQS